MRVLINKYLKKKQKMYVDNLQKKVKRKHN